MMRPTEQRFGIPEAKGHRVIDYAPVNTDI